ncbi:MAG: hypothetical protein [Bacteriophage sp.]|nr:MAG: hypothetical protein [Bacteriophage sp.]
MAGIDLKARAQNLVKEDRLLTDAVGIVIKTPEPTATESVTAEYTGGSVSYYSVRVGTPFNPNSPAYVAECQDIINALKLDFNEGSAFKAIWRRAAARQGKQKRGYDNGLYDAEKVEFYGYQMKRTTPVADQESN